MTNVIDTTAIAKKLAAVAEQELRAQLGTLVDNYTRFEQSHNACMSMFPFIASAPRERDPQQELIASLQRDIASRDARITELEAMFNQEPFIKSEKEPFPEKEAPIKSEKEPFPEKETPVRRAKNKSVVKLEESATRLAADAAKLEAERLAKLEAEKLETERLAKLEAEKLETERLAKLETEEMEEETEEEEVEEEIDELVIGGKKYFVSSITKTVYTIDANGDPGDELGTLVNGKIVKK